MLQEMVLGKLVSQRGNKKKEIFSFWWGGRYLTGRAKDLLLVLCLSIISKGVSGTNYKGC